MKSKSNELRATPLVISMSVVALSLSCLVIAYELKLFYYGQIKLYARQEYGMFIPEEDFYHRPLYGCEIPKNNDIHTHFFHVNVTQHDITTSNIYGGGMASYGNDLYLLTGDGGIYQVTEDAIMDTGIRAPYNNNQSYEERARKGELPPAQGTFRYIDIAAQGDVLYVSYTEWHNAKECYTLNVARYGDDEWDVIFRTSPCLPAYNNGHPMRLIMSGGGIELHHGNLLLTTGDFTTVGHFPIGSDPQDESSDYGKVLMLGLEDQTKEIVSKRAS